VFLPDGHRFVFWILGGTKAGIYLGSLDSPGITRLTPDLSTGLGIAAPDWLFLMRSGRLTAVRLDADRATLTGDAVVVADSVGTVGPTSAFAVSLSGTVVHWPGLQDMTQLTWVRRDGTPDGTIGPVGSFVNVEISPDGRQVAADRWDPQPAIWVMDVRRGTTTRETFGGAYESTPVWAPDSSRFVYAASSDLPPNVFQRRVGGGADDGLVFRNRQQSFPQAWAPDGRVIVTTIDPDTGADLWIMPMEGDHTPSALIRTPNSETHARVSPDGRWLAYQSNESGGRTEVYVTSYPRPEGRVPVSNGGGTRPIWSHNGRELYYVAPGGAVMAVGVGPGKTFEAGVPASLFKIPGALRSLGIAAPYDAAEDGRFLVNMPVERRSPPATVVINWRGQ
jgi:serine/threonine-protein kinase